MHPLGPDLSKLSIEDLHTKYQDLQKRYIHCSRFGPFDVLAQLQMLIEDYQTEMSVRNQRQMDEMMKNDKYKGVIDIK
jgi:hypothetical protein